MEEKKEREWLEEKENRRRRRSTDSPDYAPTRLFYTTNSTFQIIFISVIPMDQHVCQKRRIEKVGNGSMGTVMIFMYLPTVRCGTVLIFYVAHRIKI